MIEHRRFRVVIVGSGHGAGADATSAPDLEIDYDGKEVQKPIK
jgi:alpha-D-xyloside xylohydrolase